MKRLAASLLLVTATFIGPTIASIGRAAAQPAAAPLIPPRRRRPARRRTRSNAPAAIGNDFRGSGDAPAVVGADFRAKWGPRATNELFTYLVQTMPPTNPGALGEQGTLNVTAYLLQINGAPAGQQPLTPRVETPLSALMTGQAPAQPAPPAGGGGRGRRARCGSAAMVLGAGTAARGRGGDANRGVTVPGEVKNYVPVTPEMLRNPPPGDWLIFRRNYHGHSHSPLNQITPANVKNLQLQWVWAMNDSGANQTTPIVHNGVIYLATPEQHRPGARRQDRNV